MKLPWPDRRSRLLWILPTVFFAALTAYVTHPQVRDLRSTVGLHGDALFSVWRLAWIARQLPRDPLTVFDANIFYPERNTLAFSDAILLPGAMLAPAHWVGVPPLVVYNVFLLATFTVCGLAMFALVRSLTGSIAAGLLAGMSFAFCTHRLEHFERLELLTSFWMPVCLLFLHRATSSDGTAKHYVLASVCATAQVLTGIYHGIFLLTYLALFLPSLLINRLRHVPVALALTLLMPALVLALYSQPYMANRQRVGERPVAEVKAYSATLSNFIASHPNNRLYGATTSRFGQAERFLFPGVVAVLLAILACWPPLGRLPMVYLIGLALAVLLVVGFNGPLYPLLYEYALPYRGLRVPARANVLVGLSLSVLAGFGAARLLTLVRSRGARAGLAGVLLVAATAEYAAAPPLRTVPQPSRWTGWLARQERGPVFEWPTATPERLDVNDDTLYMYFSTFHWQPLVNGYSGFYPPRYVRLLDQVRDFPDEPSLSYLKQHGIRYLIVHAVPADRRRYDAAIQWLRQRSDVEMLLSDPHDELRTTILLMKP